MDKPVPTFEQLKRGQVVDKQPVDLESFEGVPDAVSLLDTVEVNGFEGYHVSRCGRVFSSASNWRGLGVRELHQFFNKSGYPYVRFTVDGKRTKKPVHRLVADAFLPPHDEGQDQIRHLNGVKTDNRDVNLKWGTAQENAEDRERHGNTKRGEARTRTNLTDADIVFMRVNDPFIRRRALAEMFGVSKVTVAHIISRRTWKHVVIPDGYKNCLADLRAAPAMAQEIRQLRAENEALRKQFTKQLEAKETQ